MQLYRDARLNNNQILCMRTKIYTNDLGTFNQLSAMDHLGD